jgi:hypothetical protein
LGIAQSSTLATVARFGELVGLFRFAREADEDAKAGNRDVATRISDVKDRELLPGSSLSNQYAGSLVECEYRSAEERVTATWASAT